MNNQEAKFILGSYRSNGADATDPHFAEALKQAQQDPALGAWFAREQAHDREVAAKLRAIAPPAGLREEILAGGRMSRRRRSGWRAKLWLPLAIAAAAAVAVSAMWWQRSGNAESRLVNFALSDMRNEAQHGGHGENLGALQASLQDPTKPLTRPLPIDFATLEKTGCRTLDVGGHPVLEICFQRNGTWFHCYIARVEEFRAGQAERRAATFAENGNVSAVAWVNGAHRFVVASLAGRDALRRLL